MGDFNVDRLKISDNNAAGDFYNMFSSYFLTPFVLQPSRLKATFRPPYPIFGT